MSVPGLIDPRVSIAENNKGLDKKIKIINLFIKSMTNQITGTLPLELIFGQKPNILSTLAKSPTLTYRDLVKNWNAKHEMMLQKTKGRIHPYKETSTLRKSPKHIHFTENGD